MSYEIKQLPVDRLGQQSPSDALSTDLHDEKECLGNEASEIDYREHPLYTAIQQFPLDKPEISLSFSDRLARDCMWTKGYALRVCEEYRRFLFLCCIADHVVTPSDDVDQAWHLHLTYTQSYWYDLCADVLGRPLHHTPTEGGEEQLAFYRECYSNTLESYWEVFSELPPPDIWPDVATRFAQAGARRLADTTRFWLVPKPSQWPIKPIRFLTGIGFLGLGVTAMSTGISGFIPSALFLGGIVWTVSSISEFGDLESAGDGADGSGCGGCGGCGG